MTNAMKVAPIIVVLLLLAVVVALVAGCGGGDDKTQAPADPATVETKPAQDSCDAKGINAEQGKEGTCKNDDGSTLTLVNRRSPLKLDGFVVRLKKLYAVKRVEQAYEPPLKADGRYVIVELRITNTAHSPFDWNSGLNGRVSLVSGDNTYAHNGGQAAFAFATKRGGVEASLSASEPIQPDATKTRFVGFEVPAKAAAHLTERGSGLIVVSNESFGTGEPGADGSRYGQVRFWK